MVPWLQKLVLKAGSEGSFSFSQLYQSIRSEYSALGQKLDCARGKMRYLPHDNASYATFLQVQRTVVSHVQKHLHAVGFC